MNKKLKVLPILAMGLMLVACNGGTSSSTPTSKKDDINFTLKVGSYVALGSNKNQIEVSTAAVILKEDKIVDAYFDVLQAPFTITDGTIALDATTNQTKNAGDKVIETKQELKERYGMKGTSSTEWYEHTAAFAKYVVGKTIDEVTSQNYKSHYNKDGTVEIPGCTISTGNFTTALKVITDTKEFKAAANTVSAGIGMKVTALDESNVLTVTYAGSATDKSGKVYETSVNAYQIPVTVDTTGEEAKIAIDTTKTQTKVENFANHTIASGTNTYYTSVLSKREEKELYGMKGSATAGEWYTQADNFAKYAKGKVASELVGKNYKSHYNESGTEEVPGCTITMTDFATAISKSATNKSSATAK